MPRRALPAALLAALALTGCLTLPWPLTGDADTSRVDYGPVRLGADAKGAAEAPGAAYGMTWAGEWAAADGFRAVAEEVALALAHNATPVVQWYYWGGTLTRENVERGADGKTREEWFRLAKDLAVALAAVTRGREVLVVLETEFNHPDIVGWEAFDRDLATQARLFHEHLPGAKVVLGFGSWNPDGWSTFPQAVAACDILGFQLMRGPGREGALGVRSAHLAAYDTAEEMHARFPRKPILLHDLAITTYGHPDGEALQAEAIERILADREALRGFGVLGIVYRSVRDDPSAPDGYYGEGERHFGLKRADGTPKPAWSAWSRALQDNP